MSVYSKRIKINTNVLVEYIFDDSNFKSENYSVLTNLKEKTKSYISSSTINNETNSLFLVDPILSKYSPINIDEFNFLRLQNYFTAPVEYDKLRIYFPSGFEFQVEEYIGFYVNIYTYGFNNNTKYSLSNFYYTIDNIDTINIFNLHTPFYFDEKMWVKSIDLEIPSVNSISNSRILSGNSNTPTPNTINQHLTYGEGLSTTSPIFIDFAYITSSQLTLGIPYFFTGDLFSVSLAQVPEFTELGISIKESTQGDFFEINATYLGSNENMDEFEYKQRLSGNRIRLEYVVNLYEENILTTTQTFQITENFTKKILYRPIIQFSNTTAVIDVELKIVNLVDNSHISKFGSIGITNSINKYGLRLTRLNVDDKVINTNIYNLKVRNSMKSEGVGIIDSFVDIMRVPYPVMVDKYRILAKSARSSRNNNNDYVSNGLLEILITSFDNIIQFNIAQDINQDGDPVPYDLSAVSVNSTLKLVFKSDSEKLEKLPFFEADNNYELGNVSFKIQERDHKMLRRIFDKGFDNFYLTVSANGVNTQLYSGKFIFYEDVTFVREANLEARETTATERRESISAESTVLNTERIDSADRRIDRRIVENNPFAKKQMPNYEEDKSVDKNYVNLLVYVRFQTNIDKMDNYLRTIGISPEIKYGNMYFLRRIYRTTVSDIKNQPFIEKIFDLPLNIGTAPKKLRDESMVTKNLTVYKNPPTSPTSPPTSPTAPPRPNVILDRNNLNGNNRTNGGDLELPLF